MTHERLTYPTTRQDEAVVDNIHGIAVKDPFRWLEDPDSEETKAWVTAQNDVFFNFLKTYCTGRDALRNRMEAMYNYPKISCPFRRGNYICYFMNDGLQNQSVLYTTASLGGTPSVLLDPNQLASDGTAALGTYSFSESGKYLAYGVALAGSDWNTIYVKDVETGEVLPDVCEWVKFSGIAWTHDDKGFYYCHYPAPKSHSASAANVSPDSALVDDKRGSEVDSNYGQKLYYHRIGSPQSEDTVVYAAPEFPRWRFGPEVTDDGQYLVISVDESTDPVNQLYYAALSAAPHPGAPNIVKLIDNFEAAYEYITNEGTVFYFRTNRNAPRYKVIAIDIANHAEEHWRDIIPEVADVLNSASIAAGNLLVVCYMHDVKEILQLFDLDGKLVRNLELPSIGSIAELRARKQDSDIFYKFSSFTYPGTTFQVDLVKGTDPVVFKETVIPDYDPRDFKTEQVFYESKDGTKIPMFIVCKKDYVPSGDSPTLLYGYGGFNISLTPFFSIFRMIFVQALNGLYCIPNLRGGGEYGEDWHRAGTVDRKQKVFDDFQGAAEYLIKHRYTTSSKLCINGGSNGGLLVAACVNQRPDLFRCGLAQVGVMDMLRFHKFTIGHAWTSDYGCADKASDFEYLIKYSPLHNVRGFPVTDASTAAAANPAPVQYPCVLLTTGDHDDRVVPLHSFKLAATLQTALGSQPYQHNPLLIRIETKAGHGAGKPTSKVIDEVADAYAFIAFCLSVPVVLPT